MLASQMRLVAWFVLLMALILAGWMVMGESLEQRFSLEASVAMLDRAGSFAWLFGWGLLVADVVLPIPGTVVMSALGWVYGFWWGGLAAASGSFLAGSVAYGLGRLIGEKGARFLLGEKDLRRGREFFHRGGGWMVCLSRALPVLPEAIACTAGLVRMPLKRFLAALACGCLPMGFVFAWIGAAGRDEPVLALTLSLALPVVLWVLSRLLSRRLERRVETPDD